MRVQCSVSIDIFTTLPTEVLIEHLMAFAAKAAAHGNAPRSLHHIESGSTAVEYALIASFTAVTVMTAATIGNPLAIIFNTIAAALILPIP